MRVVLFKSWSDTNGYATSVVRPGVLHNDKVIPVGSNPKTIQRMKTYNELVWVGTESGIKKPSAVQWDYAVDLNDVQIVATVGTLPMSTVDVFNRKYRPSRWTR